MKNIWTRLVSVITLWSVVTPQSQGNLRRLRQFNESLVVEASSEVQLQEVIQNLNSEESVFINIDSVNLTRTLNVTSSNVTVRGRGQNETVLHCSERARNAFSLRGYGIRIYGLTIAGCTRESAVVVDGRNGTRSTEVSVSFVDVGFVQNGRIESSVRGAGISVEACLEESCTRPEVNVTRCSFANNTALVGGAIHGSNCVLRILDSSFVSNAALLSGGAVFLYGQGPDLELQSCTFTANRASDTNLSANSSLFEDAFPQLDVATVRGGGAMFVGSPSQLAVIDSNFSENTASLGGGAICLEVEESTDQVRSTVSVSFEGNTFYKNSVATLTDDETSIQPSQVEMVGMGGALSIRSQSTTALSMSVQRSTFDQNSAIGGGALYIRSSLRTSQHIRSCVFTGNEASGLGGAMLVSAGPMMINGSTFTRNKAQAGGGMFVMPNSNVVAGPDNETGNPTVFEHNIALNGGALQAMLQTTLLFERVACRHNIALRYGGALRAYSTQRPVILRGVLFENNTALVGGAISTHSVLALILDEHNSVPTRIINNAAVLGGGLYRHRGTLFYEQMHIKNTEFRGNRAVSLGDSSIDYLVGNVSRDPFFKRLIDESRRRTPIEHTTENIYGQVTHSPCGHGGGFMIDTEDLNAYVIAEIVFENVIMSGNEARVGGGGSLHVSLSFWNVEKRLHCFPSVYGVDSCQKLLFQNVTITDNKAEYAGGLFVTRPETVMLTCNRSIVGENRTLLEVTKTSFDAQNPSLDFKNDLLCTDIHSNRISDGAPIEGADVGSAAASLHLEHSDGILKNISSGERPIPACDENFDAKCPKNLTVAVKDAFNQTISRGIADSNMEITLSSVNVVGQLRYIARNGTVTISHTLAWGINISTVELKIHSSQNTSMQVIATFATRACTPGEHVHELMCIPCQSDQYGFDGSRVTCEVCPALAVCKGGAALVPRKGYWHSTPFSPRFHPCFLPGACSYDQRTEQLTEFYEDKDQLQDLLNQLELFLAENGDRPDFSSYKQCAAGYEGVLCGSCEASHGRALNGKCSKCPNRGSSIALGIVSFFSLFIIVGMSAAITLVSSKERISLVRHKLKEKCRLRKRPELQRSVSHVHAEINAEGPEPSHSSSGSSSDRTDPHSRKLLQDRLLATVQVTELLKILLNYLQITSAALRIQVEWKTGLHGLLIAEATFAGITGDLFNSPFECHFDSNAVSHPSIAAFWGRILTPITILCSLIFIFSCVWYFIEQKYHKNSTITSGKDSVIRSWRTGVIVIIIVAVYFFFIDVVRELLITVNCIQVDEATSSESARPYENFAIETEGSVWVQDTDVKCFKGAHIAVGIAGIFGLTLSVVCIVFIVLCLPQNRRNRKNEHFIARYWYLYQGYRMEWYTFGWEAAVLTRKALVAAVIVFSVHLGPSLQAALCCGILVTALMIQTILKPFIEEETIYVPEYFSVVFTHIRLPFLAPRWNQFSTSITLNGLESASLFASITVFLFAVVLNDSHSSKIAEVLFGLVSFLSNVLYLLFVFYRLYAGVHLVMDLKLELSDPPFMAVNPNGPGICAFFRKGRQIILSCSKKQVECLTDDHEASEHHSTETNSQETRIERCV